MKVQFETRNEVFQILSLQLDELLQQAKGCHLLKQTAGIRLVKNDGGWGGNCETPDTVQTEDAPLQQQFLDTSYTNLYHCARRVSLCARRITMAVVCGLKIRRFWLGKGCRARNYEDTNNFFYKGPAKQFSLDDDATDFLTVFDRACPVDLVHKILQGHNLIDGTFDHTIRMIIFRDDLKEIINLRTRIRGRLIDMVDHVTADTQITSVMKAARLRIPMFKKPSYWSNDVHAFVLIGLESSM